MKKFTITIMLLISGLLLAACGSIMPAKDNTLPPSPLVQFTPKINVQQVWSTNVGDGASKYYLRLRPAVSNGKVFTASYDGTVSAIDANSGNVLWQINTDTKLTSGVSASAGKLFVATGMGGVIALQQQDGKRLWSTKVSSTILAAPTAYAGIVLAKSIDGSLTALSARNGRQLWHFKQTVPSLFIHAASQPQFAGGFAVVGFSNGKLAALSASSGKPLWVNAIAYPKGITDIEQMVDVDVSPVVVSGIVYVATYQGYIAALDLDSGREIWRHRISAYAGIAADYSQVYVSDAKSYVWAFDSDEGGVIWRQTKLQGRQVTGPATFGNYIIVADSLGYVHWMSKANGRFVARSDLSGSGVLTPPVVSGNTVYVYTRDGYLMAFKVVK